MKAFLFTAAALMTGASILGFMDYRERSATNEFRDMYTKKGAQEDGALRIGAAVASRLAFAAKGRKALERPEPKMEIITERKSLSLKSFSRSELVPFESPVEVSPEDTSATGETGSGGGGLRAKKH